ncbi:Uncharacterised protein g5942 [Pycnogonum litorale]
MTSSLTIRNYVVMYAILRWCPLVSAICPPRCICNDADLTTVCHRASLSMVPITLNPMIRELRLTENFIDDVSGSFSVYGQLIRLDLTGNRIPSLRSGSFARLGKLRDLILKSNRINRLHREAFKGLLQLENLVLAKNLLNSVSGDLFANLPSLRQLDIAHNNIRRIHPPPQTIKNITLRILKLGNNNVSSIGDVSGDLLRAIRELDLSWNRIRTIEGGTLGSIRILLLDSCGITRIEGGRGFADSIRVLSLMNNSFTEASIASVVTLRTLTTLRLGGQMLFTEFDNPLCARDADLRDLTITGMPSLVSVATTSLSSCRNLIVLSITENPNLKSIQTDAFSSLGKLRRLRLERNALTTISSGLIPIGRITFLDITGNEFVCNCSLSWLKDFLIDDNRSSIVHRKDEIACSDRSDPNLDLTIVSLDDRNLNCRQHSSSLFVVIYCAVAATVFFAMLAFVAFVCRKRLDRIWTANRSESQSRFLKANSSRTEGNIRCIHIPDYHEIYGNGLHSAVW